MARKYDLLDVYVGEYSKYEELKLLGASRTSTGNPSFTSTSSGATYAVSDNTGQNGLLLLLQNALVSYLIFASDFNSKIDNTYTTSTGSSNAYIITLSTPILSYEEGQIIIFKANFTNTASATVNISGLGAITIKRSATENLVAGDIISGQIVTLIYDGTYFQLVSTSKSVSSLLTTQGDMLYASSAYTPARLPKGTAYQNLGMNSSATAPQWQASLQSLMTTYGDMVYAAGDNAPARLPITTDSNKVLGMSDGLPSWQYAPIVYYVPSDTQILTRGSEEFMTSTREPNYQTIAWFRLSRGGFFRLKTDLKIGDARCTATIRVLYNDFTICGTGSSSTSYTNCVSDSSIVVPPGAKLLIQLRISGNYDTTAYATNLRVCADIGAAYPNAWL